MRTVILGPVSLGTVAPSLGSDSGCAGTGQCSKDLRLNTEVTLSKEESHHIARVLRLQKGELISVLCLKTHRRFTALISKVGTYVNVVLQAEEPIVPKRSRVYGLLFALCKGEKNDLVVEKACELGVAEVIIWQAERSVVKLSAAKDISKKIARWNKVAVSAAKQCQTILCSRVTFAPNLVSALQETQRWSQAVDGKFTCSLESEAVNLNDIPPAPFASVVVVGPEGDFTQREYQALDQASFTKISLGPLVLRAETAAIASISGLNAIFGFTELGTRLD